MLTGDNGFLQKTGEAKIKTEEAVEKENVQLISLSLAMHGITTEELNKELKNTFHNDIEAYEYKSGWIYTANKKYLIDEDGGVEIAHVPDEYKEVEYIESTGTQYINLNTPLKTTTGFYIKFLRSTVPYIPGVDGLWGAYSPSYFLFMLGSYRGNSQKIRF